MIKSKAGQHGQTTVHFRKAPTHGRVFLIENCPIVGRAAAKLISNEKGLELCGVANGCKQGMEILGALKPDLVVLGAAFNCRGGLADLKEIKAAFPGLPVLIFAIDDEKLFAPRAMRAGADGYVMKDEPTKVLVEAIRRVLSGGTYVSDQIKSRVRQRSSTQKSAATLHPLDSLNERELQVFRLVGQGQRRREIARRLGMTVKNVDRVRGRIKEKLCLSSASDVVRHAVEMEREINAAQVA